MRPLLTRVRPPLQQARVAQAITVGWMLIEGVIAVGAGLMAWGAWQEYQIVKPAMPNLGGTTTPPPSAPPAAPAAPPAAPAAPPVDNTDEAPPV